MEPILVRLARANAPLLVVEEVLALWVQEAERAAAGASAGGTGTGSSGQAALEHAAYSADMASVRSAPPEARRVFSTAMQATLEHVHARQNGLDVRAALALHACLAVERRADEAREAVAAVAAAVAKTAADAGQHAAATEVARTAALAVQEATEVASFRMLAAQRGAGTAVLPEEFSGPVTGMHEPDDWENVPGAMSGEAEPDIWSSPGLVASRAPTSPTAATCAPACQKNTATSFQVFVQKIRAGFLI